MEPNSSEAEVWVGRSPLRGDAGLLEQRDELRVGADTVEDGVVASARNAGSWALAGWRRRIGTMARRGILDRPCDL